VPGGYGAAVIDLSRPRDLGQILSGCWELYRRHFIVFATIALAVVAPMNLITLGLIEGKLTSGFDVHQIGGSGPAYTLVQTLVTVPLITAGHVYAVLQVSRGQEPRAGDSLSRAGGVLPVLIGTVLLYSLGVVVGVIALIVPGIYLAVRWYVATQSVVAEELGPVEALRRSGELVRGQWWRVLGISLAVGLLGAVAGGVAALPVGALAAVANSGALLVLGNVIADSVILSFTALAATLLFFDLRARTVRAA
jgi:hypothetical protein